MAKRGDVEISNSSGTVFDTGQAIAVVEGAAAPQAPAMEVGASLTDLLIGKQPDTINLANKSTSVENSDSALYAAIISGDTDYVARRMASTGVKGEGAALLLIRTKRKAEEKGFTNSLLAAAAEKIAQEARRTDDQQAYVQARNVDAYNIYQEERLEAKERRLDIFGGYLAAGVYHDRFGGSYDDIGYRSADGMTITSYEGETLNKRDRTITTSDGDVYEYSAPVAAMGLDEFMFRKAKDLGGDTPSSLRLADAYAMFEAAGATPDMLDDIQMFLETGQKPLDKAINAIIDVVMTDPSARKMIADMLADSEAISLAHRLLIGPTAAAPAAADIAAAPVPGDVPATPAAAMPAGSKSSFTSMPASAAAAVAAANTAATVAKATVTATTVGEAIAANAALAKAANETAGGAVELVGKTLGIANPKLTVESAEFVDQKIQGAISKGQIIRNNLGEVSGLNELSEEIHRDYAYKNVCDHVDGGHCKLSDGFKDRAAKHAGDIAARKEAKRQEMLAKRAATTTMGVRRAERGMGAPSTLKSGFQEHDLGDTSSTEVTAKKVDLHKHRPKPKPSM